MHQYYAWLHILILVITLPVSLLFYMHILNCSLFLGKVLKMMGRARNRINKYKLIQEITCKGIET